jgi:hypothetical protein
MLTLFGNVIKLSFLVTNGLGKISKECFHFVSLSSLFKYGQELTLEESALMMLQLNYSLAVKRLQETMEQRVFCNAKISL